jgi:hypothetical protein
MSGVPDSFEAQSIGKTKYVEKAQGAISECPRPQQFIPLRSGFLDVLLGGWAVSVHLKRKTP